MTSLPLWQRLESPSGPVYIFPDKPDWLVPTPEAAVIIDRLLAGLPPQTLAEHALFSQLGRPPAPAYTGRAGHLQLESLKECWFHITNHCNLCCEHCLFSAGPTCRESLARVELDRALAQAQSLGCRLYLFTGGEPFMYPDFSGVIKDVLQDPANHVVVLTNGLLLDKHLAALADVDPARLHFQVSVDGLQESHDRIRGKGAFKWLMTNLALLTAAGFSATISTVVCRDNLADMVEIVRLAAQHGTSVHFLWHFQRGKGSQDQHVAAAEILPQLLAAQKEAQHLGVKIDNIETLRTQVFATPGTRFDLSNSGWESLAVGPDGHIYPSPALVGVPELDCGTLAQGLETVWRTSPVLAKVRQATLQGSTYDTNPLRFLIGGGDIDHSYLAGGAFSGHDPYVELYNGVALWLIAQQAKAYPEPQRPELILKMGDVRYDCPDGKSVTLTHCNCVVALADGHASVREFYSQAAQNANEGIVNPFAGDQAAADFIPAVAKKRSYGCGSPVQDAAPSPGETLVDLGSGSGVECFMAAEKVGAQGRVFGIDMTDAMLELATSSIDEVATRLGYSNVQFKKGFLEAIPLPDTCADVVISNCVINLSPDKRQTFQEVMRVLKPGGRLVVSDIVSDEPIPVSIKNDEQFRGECLGGAMLQEDLMAMLRTAGFTTMELIKRFPYRQVEDARFYSLTFRAWKPSASQEIEVIYRGPFAAVYTEDGQLLLKGKRTKVSLANVKALGESVLVVDDQGTVTNMAMASSCCSPQPLASLGDSCCTPDTTSTCGTTPPEEKNCCGGEGDAPASCCDTPSQPAKLEHDCMVCGKALSYNTKAVKAGCHYCGRECRANIRCPGGHFVCDHCHQKEGLAIIRKICLSSKEVDMITLLKKIRSQQAIPMHGPEHHAMLPGIILAVARNSGLAVSSGDILTGIERGSKVPGGSCGFMGSCGAATGAGIAFAVLFEATPLTPGARQKAQAVTSQVLAKIAEIKAGRCCQRETYVALREVAEISAALLDKKLAAHDSLACSQYALNRECVRKQCLLWETRDKQKTAELQFIRM
ncbi:MAG: methyltransferase domain-containing protein [Proteobacteria bacterium]|nr:methyltransferase domain-containing protein [Pseudomonadota bacterium]MBU1639175.1 methyltransferase domain-containing protein [Pseudomonadota bacterium]